jgi:hypothetical protein
MVTSLVAVAVPAYAGDVTPGTTGAASTVQNGLQPGANPASQAAPDNSSSSAPSSGSGSSSAAAPGSSTQTSPGQSTTQKSGGSNAPATTTTNSSSASSNPVADLGTCLAAAGMDPTKSQKCFSDAAAGLQGMGGGGSGGGGGTPDPKAALTTFFACVQTALTAKSTAAGEQCGTDLFAALGIKQAKCLDPALQPLLKAIDGLLAGSPAALQAALADLPKSLPGELQQLPICLQGAPPATKPTKAPVTSTGTKSTSGAAVSDPIAAVAVAAQPNFTG